MGECCKRRSPYLNDITLPSKIATPEKEAIQMHGAASTQTLDQQGDRCCDVHCRRPFVVCRSGAVQPAGLPSTLFQGLQETFRMCRRSSSLNTAASLSGRDYLPPACPDCVIRRTIPDPIVHFRELFKDRCQAQSILDLRPHLVKFYCGKFDFKGRLISTNSVHEFVA